MKSKENSSLNRTLPRQLSPKLETVLATAIQTHWPVHMGEIMGMEPSGGQSIAWTVSSSTCCPKLQVNYSYTLYKDF